MMMINDHDDKNLILSQILDIILLPAKMQFWISAMYKKMVIVSWTLKV